jgi:tetratricopeptide (TPR) repeat protein
VPDLRVAARTSSFHFKGHTGDVSDVARQLNVATILEGSVRRAGNRVRVTAQLVNASDGFPLWSETYDRQLDDIFGIQEEIAIQVVDALKITLLGEDAQRLAARPTDSIEAYDAYLLGHQRMRRRRAESLEEATGYFQRAIDLDPGFTLAYVGLAQANIHLSNYGTLSKSEMVERVEPLLDKALELDDKLGEAHAVHGLFRQERFDIDDAVTEFERAIELNPNYALAYMWYGNVMNMRDPERGMTLLRQALELDPLSPLIHHNIASNLRTAGRYDEALRGFERVVEIDPGFSVSYQAIADLYEEDLGRPDEAIGGAERAVESDPGNLGLRVGLGNRLRNRGEFDDALKVYRETIDLDPGYVPAYRAIADLHAARGRLDEAARWNHEAYQREPSFQDTLISMANLYVRLSDEPSARLWHSRLKESEEVEFLSGFVQARIHARHGELARSEAILRELAARVPRFGRIWIFGWDLEAGNYDAILAREAQYEPTLFEDDPEVNFRGVPARAGRGGPTRPLSGSARLRLPRPGPARRRAGRVASGLRERLASRLVGPRCRRARSGARRSALPGAARRHRGRLRPAAPGAGPRGPGQRRAFVLVRDSHWVPTAVDFSELGRVADLPASANPDCQAPSGLSVIDSRAGVVFGMCSPPSRSITSPVM